MTWQQKIKKIKWILRNKSLNNIKHRLILNKDGQWFLIKVLISKLII